MFTTYLAPSYPGGNRIFVPAKASSEVHALLKGASMWGGHDKTEEFNGIPYLGYEIPNEKIGLVYGQIIKLECS